VEVFEDECTLEERLQQGTLDFDDAVGIIDDVIEEIADVHADRRVDRALTPERVVLYRAGGRVHARLSPPRVGESRDAFQCMAPEQVRGSRFVDRRADVYALGVVAFVALTRRFPFEETNACVLIAKKLEHSLRTLESVSGRPFPPLVELFVATATATDRDRRYPRIEVARAAWREATPVKHERLTL
jgi:serine/threonine-protein kinase